MHRSMDSFFYDPWGYYGGRHPHHRSLGRSMESPYFYPFDSWSAAAPPRHHGPYCSDPYPPAAYASRPRVVSVPVSYVRSDSRDKNSSAPSAESVISAAAVTLQRFFRGYLARKNIKVVSQVAAELGAIEQSVRSQEELLRADPKERLRVNEMLMALLFRLDSVRGIRDYRKMVIRRVIVLQEFLDSISAGTLESTNSGTTEAPIGAEMLPDSDTVHQEAGEIPSNSVEESMAPDCQDPASGAAEEVVPREGRDPISATPEDDVNTGEEQAADDGYVIVSMDEATVTSPAAPNSDEAPAFESMEQENQETTAAEAQEVSTITTTMADGAIEEGAASRANSAAGASGTEVLKRVMAENKRLQGLVAVLCQRKAQQCQLMMGLAERVEQLERAMQKKDMKRRSTSSLASPADKTSGPTKQ